MAKISGWEKFRKAVTGSYSDKLSIALAQEALEERRAILARDKARAEAAAKSSAGTGKVSSADPKKPAAKKPAAKKATETKKPAAKKPAPKKKSSK